MRKDLGVPGFFAVSFVFTCVAIFLSRTWLNATFIPVIFALIAFIFGMFAIVRSIKEKNKMLLGTFAILFPVLVLIRFIYLINLQYEQAEAFLIEANLWDGSSPLEELR